MSRIEPQHRRHREPAETRRVAAMLLASLLLSIAPLSVSLATPEPVAPASAVRAEPASAAAQKSENAAIARPPLWRLADEDSEIFLIAAFHATPSGLDWRSVEIARAIDAAETIVFEAEFDAPGASARARAILARDGVLPAGETLSTRINAENAARLASAAADVGVDAVQFEPMRPWQAFLVLNIRQLAALGFDPAAAIDQQLLKEARARGRTVRFLQTVDEQLAQFAELSPAEEKRLLALTLRDWSSEGAELHAMSQAWAKGDVEALDAGLHATMRAEAPAVYQSFVAEQNARFADAIAAMLARPGASVVVLGAGRLVGPDGAPALLARKGIAATRVGE